MPFMYIPCLKFPELHESLQSMDTRRGRDQLTEVVSRALECEMCETEKIKSETEDQY